jgi:hypothetical protein
MIHWKWNDIASSRGPGEEPHACTLNTRMNRGKGSASQGRSGLSSPNECNELGCPQAILLPTCPDIASLLLQERLARFARGCRVLFRKSMAGEGLVADPGLQV